MEMLKFFTALSYVGLLAHKFIRYCKSKAKIRWIKSQLTPLKLDSVSSCSVGLLGRLTDMVLTDFFFIFFLFDIVIVFVWSFIFPYWLSSFKGRKPNKKIKKKEDLLYLRVARFGQSPSITKVCA